ncbi:hypothetical protein ACHAWF_007373, partial [Thalassiosira exigua]
MAFPSCKAIGSRKPHPVKNAALSKAQNPMRPTSFAVPPTSFHAGVSGGFGTRAFPASSSSIVVSRSCVYDPMEDEREGNGRYIRRPNRLTVLAGGANSRPWAFASPSDGPSRDEVAVVAGPHPTLDEIRDGSAGRPGREATREAARESDFFSSSSSSSSQLASPSPSSSSSSPLSSSRSLPSRPSGIGWVSLRINPASPRPFVLFSPFPPPRPPRPSPWASASPSARGCASRYPRYSPHPMPLSLSHSINDRPRRNAFRDVTRVLYSASNRFERARYSRVRTAGSEERRATRRRGDELLARAAVPPNPPPRPPPSDAPGSVEAPAAAAAAAANPANFQHNNRE